MMVEVATEFSSVTRPTDASLFDWAKPAGGLLKHLREEWSNSWNAASSTSR
jgi:hypothetical protein